MNLAVPVTLAEKFDSVAQRYGNAKQKGLSLSAALLMFIEAHPQEQVDHIKRVRDAELQDLVDEMVQEALRRQSKAVASRGAMKKAGEHQGSRPKKAASTRKGNPRSAKKPKRSDSK